MKDRRQLTFNKYKAIVVLVIVLLVLTSLPLKSSARTLPSFSPGSIMSEDIKTTGVTAYIDLDGNTWASDVGQDYKKKILIDNMHPRSNAAAAEWNKIVDKTIRVSLESETRLVIEFPQTADYNIRANQVIDVRILPSLLERYEGNLSCNFTIIAPLTPQPILSGSISNSTQTTENSIIEGNGTIIINLINETWISDVGTLTTNRNKLFDGFLAAQPKESEQWNNKVINALKVANPAKIVVLSNSNKTLKITLPPVVGYDITVPQTVNLNIDSSLLTNNSSYESFSFTINPANTNRVTLTGTATTAMETDIALGKSTIVITLQGNSWVPDIANSQLKREALINGFATTGTDKKQWDKVLTVLKNESLLHPTIFTRDSSNVITITLPPVIDYDIMEDQKITLTIPKLTLSDSNNNVVVPPSFTIRPVAVAAFFGGSAYPDFTETDVIKGSSVLTITLVNGTWVQDVITNTSKFSNLLSGFKASNDTSNWELVASALKISPSNFSLDQSNKVLKIILPPIENYNIVSDQNINLVIPKTVLVSASTDIIVPTPLVIKVPVYTGWRTMTQMLADGTLAGYLKNIPLTNINVLVPKKFLNTITINPTDLVNITNVDVLTEDPVVKVRASIKGIERSTTNYSIFESKRKFSFAYMGEDIGTNDDIVFSVLDDAGNKLQSDIIVKSSKAKKVYSFQPKKDYTGTYTMYQLTNNSPLLKSILESYSLSELLCTINPMLSSTSAQGFIEWPIVTSNERNKVWAIDFTLPLDPLTINNGSISVQDENNLAITSLISISSSGKGVKIAPISSYVPGKRYRILLSKSLFSLNGSSLNSEVVVPFMITDDDRVIKLIYNEPFSTVTNISVVTKQEVSYAKVNGILMHYKGNSIFSLGVTNLTQGNSVTVQVYDTYNQLLDTKKYIIK